MAKEYILHILRRTRFAYVIVSIFIILNLLTLFASHAHPIWIGLGILGLFMWAKSINDINHDISMWKDAEITEKIEPEKDEHTL